MKSIIFLVLLLISGFSLQGQREFSWSDKETFSDVRPRSVELIRVSGDSLSVVRQLKGFREKYRWVNHIIIECPDITSVPLEVYKFNKLFKVEFDNCPRISFQKVLKSIKDHEEDIYSIGFRNMDFQGQVFAKEDALQYLEMISFVEVQNIDFAALFGALNFNNNPRYSNLGYLYFESCGMDTLHTDIVHLHNLRSLSLPRNNLKDLPENLPGKLKNLDISFNKFEKLPVETLDKLGRLKFLNLECNKFEKKELMKLRDLNRFQPGRNFDRLSSLKFACNETIVFDTLQSVSDELTPLAYYRTAASNYVNDYKPDRPDCTACNKFQFEQIKNKLYGNWKLVPKESRGEDVFNVFNMAFSEEKVKIESDNATINGEYTYEINKFVEEEFFRITLIELSREMLIQVDDDRLNAFIPMSGRLVLVTFEKR